MVYEAEYGGITEATTSPPIILALRKGEGRSSQNKWKHYFPLWTLQFSESIIVLWKDTSENVCEKWAKQIWEKQHLENVIPAVTFLESTKKARSPVQNINLEHL